MSAASVEEMCAAAATTAAATAAVSARAAIHVQQVRYTRSYPHLQLRASTHYSNSRLLFRLLALCACLLALLPQYVHVHAQCSGLASSPSGGKSVSVNEGGRREGGGKGGEGVRESGREVGKVDPPHYA